MLTTVKIEKYLKIFWKYNYLQILYVIKMRSTNQEEKEYLFNKLSQKEWVAT